MQRRRSGAGGASRPAPIANTFCWPVLAAALLLTAGLAACADVRAVWYFDEGSGQTVADPSANGNNGTLGPTVAVETNDPTWTTGKYSNALSYDGSNDYVSVPDSATLDVTSSLTIEAWVSPAVSTPYGYLVYKGGMSGAKETPLNYGLNTNVSGGQTVLEFRFRDSGGTLRVFSGLQGLINTANAWYFVAATYDDASDSVVLRVDNTTQSFTTTATMVANAEPLFIGARANASVSWPGRIDTTIILNNSGPTSVRLADVGARLLRGRVQVYWQTAVERDTAGFYVERAPRPGGPWQRINPEVILARADGIARVAYCFEDARPRPECRFYRLVTVNVDGMEECSHPVPVRREVGLWFPWPPWAPLSLLPGL